MGPGDDFVHWAHKTNVHRLDRPCGASAIPLLPFYDMTSDFIGTADTFDMGTETEIQRELIEPEEKRTVFPFRAHEGPADPAAPSILSPNLGRTGVRCLPNLVTPELGMST